MKFTTKKFLCIALALIMIMLCGCQGNPDKSIVNSKNDGSFDANVVISASEHHEPDETQAVKYMDTFMSTDGSVTFLFTIDDQITAADMPVLEVTPHFFTEEDAKNVAYALFGDAVFYEAEPSLSKNYSKSEIQERIERWSRFTSSDAIKELYGYEPGYDATALVKSFIEKYTTMYETAPEENPHIPCQWTFRKSSEYTIPAEDRAGVDMSKDNDEISAQLQIGGIPYYFTVTNRNQSDFKVNMVTACIYSGSSPDGMDESIFMAELCRTAEPTDEQLANIRNKAEQILTNMNLGQWKIDQCYVETTYYGDTPEYVVHVNAVPILNGMEVVRQPQLTNLRNDNAYASNYYHTDVNFKFSANGDLILFMMYSPLEVKETLNENVDVLNFDEMIENTKLYLQHSDYYEYGFGHFLDQVEEDVSCTVTVSQLDYNLIRVKVPNTDESYYYIPGITLRGTARYVGDTSGNLYYESEGVETLVAINGVDGTIINLDK